MKNNLLFQRMKEAGYKSNAALARACCLYPTAVSDAMNLRVPLVNRHGNIHHVWSKIADVLECSPFDLVPEKQWDEALTKNTSSIQVDANEMLQIADAVKTPEQICYRKEVSEKVRDHISMLNQKQQKCVLLYYGIGCDKLTLDEVGAEVNLSRERVRQIIVKSQRILAKTDLQSFKQKGNQK